MQVGEKLKKGRFAVAILAMITWMLSVPVLLMSAMLIVALFVVALVVPFDDLGHLGAQRYCETAASSVPVAHFSVEGRTTGMRISMNVGISSTQLQQVSRVLEEQVDSDASRRVQGSLDAHCLG
jgi:hypothetical protein